MFYELKEKPYKEYSNLIKNAALNICDVDQLSDYEIIKIACKREELHNYDDGFIDVLVDEMPEVIELIFNAASNKNIMYAKFFQIMLNAHKKRIKEEVRQEIESNNIFFSEGGKK